MATWQPPIPQGALYSKPARDLGPALALLGWCYDAVQRDGWLNLSIKEAAGAMDEPYHTVKKWWGRLRDSEFFTEVVDHGRDGFKVRFADEWLDWRILSTRAVKERSRTDEVPEMVLETAQPIAQGALKDCSRSDEGSDLVLEEKCIKEDKSQETDHSDGAPAVPPPAPKKKRALRSVEKTQTELLNTPLAIYGRITNMRSPNQAQRELIETITDLDVWESTCEFWAVNGYNVRNVANLVDRYNKNLKDKQRQSAAAASYRNGTPNGYHVAAPEDPSEYATREQLDALKRGGVA
jgi:hypothetical protein